MKPGLYDKKDVIELITAGKHLLLAGDEKSLSNLPQGFWIAGTIPYFMAEKGGEFSEDKMYVNELPDYILHSEVKIYTEENIDQVYNDAPDHGFSVIIIPASSKTHFSFALKAPSFPGFATRPLIGWIAGTSLSHTDDFPKVFDGLHTKALVNGAVVMHVEIPATKLVEIDIVNIFEQGEGDTISFVEDGFFARKALINGVERNFAEYILENNIDTHLPLVVNLYGAMINTSFKGLDFADRRVDFYAPVFAGMRYKIARPVGDYGSHFLTGIPAEAGNHVFFACNCILNYLYAELEGRRTADFTGPITFGEIAYQLLNQTMAYMTITDA